MNSLNQIELESRALIRTASALNVIKENWETRHNELDEALEKTASSGRLLYLPCRITAARSRRPSEPILSISECLFSNGRFRLWLIPNLKVWAC